MQISFQNPGPTLAASHPSSLATLFGRLKAFIMRPSDRRRTTVQKLVHRLVALFLATMICSSAEATSLTEDLKKHGTLSAVTLEEVAVRDAPPKQGFLVVDTGNKIAELTANTNVTITEERELKTLIGPFIYVKLKVKHPQTGKEITGWAWYGDGKKSQFKLIP
jgi:hypothetical protein